MNLSRILISLAILSACTGFRSVPERPWRIEVSTSGGLTGRGVGGFTVDSDRKVEIRRMNGEVCRYTMTEQERAHIERVFAEAKPDRWRDSYLPKDTCCDRVISTFTVDEAGKVVTTKWIDGPPAAPEDLAALANAIIGREKSIRAESAERCK